MLREIEQRAVQSYRNQFQAEPVIIVSAPGRVNLIGEHTDYNGGFVLPMAIDRRVAVAMGPGRGGLYAADFGESRPLTGTAEGSWADYPRGVTSSIRAAGHDVPDFQAAFAGDVPHGAGLSSSAAIEAATALGIDTLFRLDIARQELAILCQRAENEFVGVNSGIMDQYVSLLARAGTALLLDTRDMESQYVPLPLKQAGLTVLVADTGVKRGLKATGYNERRAVSEGAARTLGVGSLREASVADLERLTGEEEQRARHVITENDRVLRAARALRAQDFITFGQLMSASHASLRDQYEVSTPELNAFVALAEEGGALGARLTGAGFGGSAIALLPVEAVDPLKHRVQERFAALDFTAPTFYVVSPAAGAEVVQQPAELLRDT